ncbi:hypothetical protein Ac2012v2_006256 [Leucoagaricus gongylophorus]
MTCPPPLHVLVLVLRHLPPSVLLTVRTVGRTFFLIVTLILRTTFLPLYLSHVRFSSDPLPPVDLPPYAPLPPQTLPFATAHRESIVLDRFIVLTVRHNLLAAHSLLHSHRPDSFRDLFNYHQPKARLEDLVRSYGLQQGLSIPFTTLSVSLSPRTISLVSGSGPHRRTLAHVLRQGSLEQSAQSLVTQLKMI